MDFIVLSAFCLPSTCFLPAFYLLSDHIPPVSARCQPPLPAPPLSASCRQPSTVNHPLSVRLSSVRRPLSAVSPPLLPISLPPDIRRRIPSNVNVLPSAVRCQLLTATYLSCFISVRAPVLNVLFLMYCS